MKKKMNMSKCVIKSFQSVEISCISRMKTDSALLMAHKSQCGCRKINPKSTKSLQALLIPAINLVR